jgi:hypothetical protein
MLTTHSARRRWLPFGVKWLFLGMVIAAAVLAANMSKGRRIREHRERAQPTVAAPT